MTYYCSHCIFKRKRLEKMEIKYFGLYPRHTCPVCRDSNPITKNEITMVIDRMKGKKAQSVNRA